MSSNTFCPLPKEYYTPSESVRKACGDLDGTKKALFSTSDTVFKVGNTDMAEKKGKIKPDVVKEAITPTISEKKNI